MKKTFALLLTAALAFGFIACSDDDDNTQRTLISSIITKGGDSISIIYDNQNRISEFKSYINSVEQANASYNVAYLSDGNISKITYGNGYTNEFRYNKDTVFYSRTSFISSPTSASDYITYNDTLWINDKKQVVKMAAASNGNSREIIEYEYDIYNNIDLKIRTEIFSATNTRTVRYEEYRYDRLKGIASQINTPSWALTCALGFPNQQVLNLTRTITSTMFYEGETMIGSSNSRIDYSYKYNDDGFPSMQTESRLNTESSTIETERTYRYIKK